MVDENRILDIIDRMRVSVPEELKQARRIVSEQDRLLQEAQQRVHQAMEEQGLLKAVEEERERLLDQAELDATNVRGGADDYARQVLEELEQRLEKLTLNVQNGLKALR
ncbi:MAG: hypothetical protein GFH23_1086718n31 [Chloroflexi bacterium AL-N1]|nr:hypothetical protein [Chloroflexi bacterium AL-N1]NOK77314.1 hypothetical protein [Chloroflexi bacterium AL-N5]